MFGGVCFPVEQCLARVTEHGRAVVSHFDSVGRSRLLIMNIPCGHGWEPLCEFLERPVPCVPFPHVRTNYQRLPWGHNKEAKA